MLGKDSNDNTDSALIATTSIDVTADNRTAEHTDPSASALTIPKRHTLRYKVARLVRPSKQLKKHGATTSLNHTLHLWLWGIETGQNLLLQSKERGRLCIRMWGPH
jgi:hypothetical protein